VQHRWQPHPPGLPIHTPYRDRSSSGSRSVRFRPGRPDVEARTTNSGTKATCHNSKPSASSRSATAQPISRRNTTDLGAGYDRSRRGLRPISAL